MKGGWYLVLVMVVGTVAGCEFDCGIAPNCQCEKSLTKRRITCYNTDNETAVTATVEPDSYITIQCENTETDVLDLLAGLRLCPLNTVQLKACPPPRVSYRRLFDSIQVSPVTMLKHTHSPLDGKLTAAHMADLPFLKKLHLVSSGLTNLPEELLKGVPGLESLDLNTNRVSFPPGFFNWTPGLEILELGDTHLTVERLGRDTLSPLSRLLYLNLWSNELSDISRVEFNLAHLFSLDITNNGVESLDSAVFARLANLSIVSLGLNSFTELPNDLFSNNTRLETVVMNHNRRNLALPAGFFANMSRLKDVIMIQSNINYLPEDLFWGSGSLRNATFSDQNISSIPPLLFRDAIELLTFDFSNNKLEELPDNLFSATRKLRRLNLSHNRLKKLSRTVFEKLTDLEELQLNNNFLHEIEPEAFIGLKKLQRAELQYNTIANFNYSQINSLLYGSVDLKHLNLSHNNVNAIFKDWSVSMVKLTTLDLSYNSITTLKGDELAEFISRPINLDLSCNKIVEIDFAYIEATAEVKVTNNYAEPVRVKLGQNPINCDCNTYHLAIFLRAGMPLTVYKMLEVTDKENVKCAGPEELEGQEVMSLSVQLLNCQWGLWGPDKRCSSSYWPAKKGLQIDCSARGLSAPPENFNRNFSLNNYYYPINHTELNFSSNALSYWPNSLSGSGYANVTVLDVSNNSLTHIDKASLPPKLEALYLNDNKLSRIDDNTLDFLRNWGTLHKLTLHQNPWICDCETIDFLDFLHNAEQVSTGKNDIRCADNERWNKSLPELTEGELCFTARLVWGILGGVIAVVGLVVGIGLALYYRYQSEVKVWLFARGLCLWFVTEEELDRNKIYDAFISYAHQDEDFVVNKLVPGLEQEGPTKFKLCLHFRDWIVGDFIPNQIARSVEDSKRTIVVLSKSFVESIWGKMEFRTAHSQALSEGRARVIVILYGEVDTGADMDPELKAYLSTNTYLKWGDLWFWEKLRYALPHPPKQSARKEKKKKVEQKHEKMALVEDESLVTMPTSGGRVLVDIRRTDPV